MKYMRFKNLKITVLSAVAVIASTVAMGKSVYADSLKATVKIPVSCIATNTSEKMTYKITSKTDESLVSHETLHSDTLGLGDKEEGMFEIDYDIPETFHYTISQIAGTDKDTTYDATTYIVDVYVTEDDEGLHAEPVIYLQGTDEKQVSASFKNAKKVEEKKADKSTDTSDSSQLLVWECLLGGSVLAIILLVVYKKSNEQGKE